MIPKTILLRLTKVGTIAAGLSFVLLANAQSSRRLQPTLPKLAPGEKLTGKEHPENFSRRIAFQTMLELLSIHPEDAKHLQRRARLLEIKRIGLNASDTASLEQIVELYRVKERERRVRAEAIHRLDNKSAEFSEMTRRHHADMKSASEAINRGISRDGRIALNGFLDDIISHSELHAPLPRMEVK